ncbi:penicillin acylase family protein [Streptomyces sp. M19]
MAGLRPTANTAAYTPPSEHPNSIGQDYYISWNNKLAKNYGVASFGDGSVHRGNLLDDRVSKLTEKGGVTRAALTRAMAEAAVTDLRGEDVLPELLKVVRSEAWTTGTRHGRRAVGGVAGGRRAAPRDLQGSKTYGHADAVRIMDAWWPLLVQAEFEPGMGSDFYDALRTNLTVDEAPSAGHGPTGSHAGSSFQYGWWSYVDKDLRAVLGEDVKGGLARPYCGDGDLSACRDALLTSLKKAVDTPRPRSTPVTTTATRATSGAPTRSSSARSAG